MEGLAFVEILDRRGGVSARHAVTRWPCRIGRGYAMDVILDDPYVAPAHAELDKDATGSVVIRDCGSSNGIYRGHMGNTMQRVVPDRVAAPLGGDELLRLGHTTLRVRSGDYIVAPELSTPRNNWSRRWPAAWFLTTFLVLLTIAQTWSQQSEEDVVQILLTAIVNFISVWIWSGFWSAMGILSGGAALFPAHLVNGCALWLAWIMGKTLIDAGTFAFGIGQQPVALYAAGGVLLGSVILFRHFRLVSRLARKTLWLAAFAIAVSLSGSFTVITLYKFDRAESVQFQSIIFPSSMLLTEGMSRKGFIEEVRQELEAPKQ